VLRASFWALSSLVLVTACKSAPTAATASAGGATPDGGGGGAGGASGTGGVEAGGPYPAPHSPMPKAITQKGPVLTAPKIVPITFQGDPLQAQEDAFITQVVAATSYWSGATAEYGVGPLSAQPPVHLSETAAAMLMDSDVQQWLTTKINGGGGFPQPDANTMYVIFYPSGTTVTMGSASLCQQFQGYHSDYQITPGQFVMYSVVGQCPPPVMGLAEIDEVSAETSHELIEMATDPLPFDMPAYQQVDADHRGWAIVGGGGEIGDLCAPFPNSFYKPTGVTSLVQRVWSNAAAAAGHDPCEPQGASPYFNSAPVLTDTIQVTNSPLGNFTTKGAMIPVGSSKTIELDLYSDAPTSGPWKVSVIDVSHTFFGLPAALSFKLDKTQGKNGDKIQLTIKALSQSGLGASPFWIQNDLGGVTTVWIGLVGN
jgi:hypothetical protein